MSVFDLGWITLLVVGACLYLGDGLNSCTAAIRELIQIARRDEP